jgi:hypothetical protein
MSTNERVLTGIITVAIALVTASVATAQAKPNFSGTWTLDVEKSDMGGRGPGGSGPGGGGPGRPMDAKVVITQTAGELSIDQQVNGNSNVLMIKLDGSESVNTGMRGGEVKSKARWDGATLIVQSVQTMRTPNGERTLETTETRSLAPDGSMIVERTTETPRGTRTQKLVFKKTA